MPDKNRYTCSVRLLELNQQWNANNSCDANASGLRYQWHTLPGISRQHTHSPPRMKIPMTFSLRERGICNFHSHGIGKQRTPRSVAILTPVVAYEIRFSSRHMPPRIDLSQKNWTGRQENITVNIKAIHHTMTIEPVIMDRMRNRREGKIRW